MIKFSIKNIMYFSSGVGLILSFYLGSLWFFDYLEKQEQKVNAQYMELNTYIKNLKNANDILIASQQKQIQSLEQKISSLALSMKTGSTDSDESQEILRLILSTHHDLDIVIQALLSDQLLQDDQDRLDWILKLDRLSPQDKVNFQRMIDQRITWDDIVKEINTVLSQNQTPVLWGVTQKLGIRVEGIGSSEDSLLEKIKDHIQNHQYSLACSQSVELSSDNSISQKMDNLCSVDNFVNQYWKSLSN